MCDYNSFELMFQSWMIFFVIFYFISHCNWPSYKILVKDVICLIFIKLMRWVTANVLPHFCNTSSYLICHFKCECPSSSTKSLVNITNDDMEFDIPHSKKQLKKTPVVGKHFCTTHSLSWEKKPECFKNCLLKILHWTHISTTILEQVETPMWQLFSGINLLTTIWLNWTKLITHPKVWVKIEFINFLRSLFIICER